MTKFIDQITNVLIFKDGFYWLTNKAPYKESYEILTLRYRVDVMWQDGERYRNGFEFASDAYSYLASLQSKQEPEYNPKEEEKLKEMGEAE